MSANPIEQFRDAIRSAGLIPPDVLEPGKFHKFPGEGKLKNNTAAWCKLFNDGIGGVYGDYSTGLTANWQASRATPYTTAEREAFKRHVAEAKAQAEADRAAEQTAARKRATLIWAETAPVQSHDYLTRKGIQGHGVRLNNGNLVLPIRDSVGTLQSLQFIGADGSKKFLTGGKVQGGYFSIGKPDGVLCICEGFATGASIHEATGYAVAVAFDCGNLLSVTKAIRGKFPDMKLIVCADDDYKTDGNPGMTKATEAAHAVGGLLAIPHFNSARPDKATDFNDLHQLVGLQTVRECIERATSADNAAPPLPQTHAPALNNAAHRDYEGRIVVVNLLDFINRDIQPRERILAPWLLTQSLNMLYAWRGVGKTHVSLGIAFAVASGGSFLKWKADNPRRVLFLDGEMPAASMQERLKGLVAASDNDFDPDYFRLITPDLQTGSMPDLATSEGQEAIEAILGDAELIIIDNLSSLARSGGRENDAESWLPIQPWALHQRQQGRSVLFVHHSGKGGAQRGTSKREDILDTVLTLKRPAEYNPEDGAVFEVHFEKTRDMHGEDVQPFEARLQTDQHGLSVWAFSSVEDSTFDRVVSLANEGLSQKEIALELEINKSNVSRHFRRATEAGLIEKGGNYGDS